MSGYHIATSVFESQYTVKKSRFIARVVPIESRPGSELAGLCTDPEILRDIDTLADI